MKKFIIFVLSIFLLLPVGVNAEKAYTKITGNEKILPGANIVYTIVMNAKNDIDPQRTSITIKTTTASSGDETFEPDEVDFGIDFVQEDSLFVEEEKPTTTKAKANKILSDIKGIINGNEGIIMWASLALNLLLLVICFVNIKRKRVDYDF